MNLTMLCFTKEAGEFNYIRELLIPVLLYKTHAHMHIRTHTHTHTVATPPLDVLVGPSISPLAGAASTRVPLCMRCFIAWGAGTSIADQIATDM